MRILITSDIFPPEAGGPSTYVPVIARELAERGHSVQVLTYSPVNSDVADATYPFEVERIVVGGPRLLRLLQAFIRIAANARRADTLYINGLLIETALVNCFLRKSAMAKVVGDIAWERARDKGWIGDEFEDFQQGRHGWRIELRRVLRNWALRQSRTVIVPSVYLKRIVTGWGVETDRVHVVYNPLEPTNGDVPTIEIPLATPHRLITVCRLATWKGVDGLIEMVASLHDVGLVVVGDGPERLNLESLAHRLGVNDRVYFAGQVPRERIPAYLRACDLFVLNSRYEGLPHVVLEALAAGLPVVATAVGGIPEVVRDGVNGRLVPMRDREALRKAIMETLGYRPHTAVPEAFTRGKMIEETTALLEAAAGR